MKKAIILSLAVMALALYSCQKPGVKPKEAELDAAVLKDTTEIEFLDSTTFYFDTIMQGEKVEHTFRIKNLGPKNFLIGNAFGSCGCTVPKYPKEPVPVGGIAEIFVTFNSEGKKGEMSKSVRIHCNTKNHDEMVWLKGFVKTKDDE